MALIAKPLSPEDFFAGLNDAITAAGYSSATLASKAGLSRTMVARIRAGSILPAEDTVNRITLALGLTEQQREAVHREARLLRKAEQARNGGRPQLRSGEEPTGYPTPAFGQPNPLPAVNPEQLQQALGAVHLWGGKPSLRQLETRSHGLLRRSTMSDMLRGKPARLPDFDRYLEFLRACGVEGPNLDIWVFTWRRLKSLESPELASWMPGVSPASTAP